MTARDNVLRLRQGVIFSRVPPCFGARCREYGLTGNEKDLLIALMARMVQCEDGSIYLVAGNASMLAKLTGMTASNVRSALASLRRKGVIKGEFGAPYRLEAEIWKLEETERSGMHPAAEGECSGMHPAAGGEFSDMHPVNDSECASASLEMQESMLEHSPIKNSKELKNAHKKRMPKRVVFD